MLGQDMPKYAVQYPPLLESLVHGLVSTSRIFPNIVTSIGGGDNVVGLSSIPLISYHLLSRSKHVLQCLSKYFYVWLATDHMETDHETIQFDLCEYKQQPHTGDLGLWIYG